jgi:hypothetical protein
MAASKHEQLVELLSQLGDRAVAEKHARRIHAAVPALSRGYDIGRDQGGFYARPRHTKPEGPAKELHHLAAAARKAIRGEISREDWMDEWAAQPRSVWRFCKPLLMNPKTRSLDKAKMLGNYSAPGFTVVVPKAEAVLPAIEVAIERLKISTGNKRQRKPHLAAYDLIAVVRAAYSALTGHRGGRANLPSGLAGKELRLGKGIDKICGTKVFPNVDSSRLRKPKAGKTPSRRSK